MNQGRLIYQNILENMSDGVLTIGLDGRIMTLNNAGEKILDIKSEDCIGRPYGELFFEMEGNDDFNQLVLDAVYESTATHNRKVNFYTGNDVRTLQVSTSFLKADGDAQEKAVIVVMNDISELERTHQAEQELAGELKQKNRELRDSYLQLEEANAGMTALLKKVQVIRITATAFIIILFLGIGVFTWLKAGIHSRDIAVETHQTQGLSPTRHIHKVSYQPLSDTLSLKSVIKPIRVINVTCPFTGSVENIFFEYGQAVEKGRLLVRMDKTEAEMQYRDAYAVAIKAEKRFHDLQNWEHNDQVVKTRRSLTRSKMRLDNYKKTFEETEYLYNKGFIPEKEYESARQQYASAKIDYEAAEHELAIIRAKGTGNNYKIARLEMENAKARLAEIERRLDLADVVAPVAGTIMLGTDTGRNKSEVKIVSGTPVSEGDILLSLGDTSGLSVEVDVDEIEVRKIRQGQKAHVSGEAFPGITLEGLVTNVSSQANTSRDHYQRPAFNVLIEIKDISPEVRGQIRLGITADVVIVVYDKPEAIQIPIQAVLMEDKGRFVTVKEKSSGLIKKVPVETGITTMDTVEIVSGLSPGDELIVN